MSYTNVVATAVKRNVQAKRSWFNTLLTRATWCSSRRSRTGTNHSKSYIGRINNTTNIISGRLHVLARLDCPFSLIHELNSFSRYYFPTYENDALLTALSDSESESEGPNHSSEVPVIAEDISNLKLLKQTSVLNKLLKDRGNSSWKPVMPLEFIWCQR